MRKKIRIAVAICAGLLLAVGLVLLLGYRATQQVPQAYRKALTVDPAGQREAYHEMDRRAMDLSGQLKKEGRWEALFTAEQINGWLAVALKEKFPDTLPESIRDPRVAIESGRVVVFCTIDHDSFQGVVSMTVEPDVPEPNVLALRVCKVRVGTLPWSLSPILDGISKAAGRANVPLRWQQAGGDPVALLDVAVAGDQPGRRVRIETVQVNDGEIYVAGRTEPDE